MVKIADLKINDLIIVKRSLEFVYEDELCKKSIESIDEETILIYDGYSINEAGLVLKFIDFEKCKIFFDLWKSSLVTKDFVKSIDKKTYVFELL